MTHAKRKKRHTAHQPTGQWIRSEKRLAIYLRDGFHCLACFRDLHGADPSDITLDHVVPCSKGGSNKASNLFMKNPAKTLTHDYEHQSVGNSLVIHADCLEWLSRVPENTLHAVVTDPPYGVKEYDFDQLEKRSSGRGGIWRIPPSFDGNTRAPLPRFTALNKKERARLGRFFFEWGKLVFNALRPGGHVFLASNAFVSQIVFSNIAESGLEFRGEIIRLVRTLRGGDRPKNAEKEFPDVSSMARGCYEPWGVFRKPMLPGMKVSDCLREFQTGAVRRYLNDKPFEDVIHSERTPKRERELAGHPSLKPQSLMRRLVFAALPMGEGAVVDPFMGSGSTIAAAEAVGVQSIGIERFQDYFDEATHNIERLARLVIPDVDNLVRPAIQPELALNATAS